MRINKAASDRLHSKIFNGIDGVSHEFQSSRETPPDGVITVKQVHGTDVVRIKRVPRSMDEYDGLETIEADAIIANIRGVAIGVRTADCLPILLYDPVNAAAAAIHAGWRGSVAGITAKTVSAMKESFGTDPANLLAALGPHIGVCCYTVGAEVVEALGERGSGFMVRDGDGDVTRLDLARLNAAGLVTAGVKEDHIGILDCCTLCESEEYFSYRADPAATGRQVSFIKITEHSS